MDSELDFLAGGEMAQRIRAFDWGRTSLGPPSQWSPALLTMLRIMLANRFPHILWWGPEYIQFYNDPYRPVPGAKHPHHALGQPASRCWSEIWHVIGPLVDTAFRGGPATWDDDILLEINRHGYLEECHFTFAYSPVPDATVPSGVGGVLATVHEITAEVLGKRRVAALRDLGSRSGQAKSAEQACVQAAATLAAHAKDIPFILLYLIDESRATARLSGACGVAVGEDVSPLAVDLTRPNPEAWPFEDAIREDSLVIVDGLAARFRTVPPGPWSDPPSSAVVLPIPGNDAGEPAGIIVAGISARVRFNQDYRDFFHLLRTQIASAIANARAYEAQRERAEKLAAIDRAKTAFFSNVSHEFRTPLTLMLGPIDELLRRPSSLTSEAREQIETVHRNGLRLLRLVNTLLEFSRIEAGRIRARYQPCDLAAATADLASVFRAAIERAGLTFVVDCPDIAAPVYVDRGMWEKIVLNLLSNALKFTFDGRIVVTVRRTEKSATLAVEDTGTGIPKAEMPRLFERFHRIENAKGRTHEGSGIGLALVHELVKLHGGTIGAVSAPGKGTTFTVSLPLGTAHLPADQIGDGDDEPPSAEQATTYVEEALQWLPASASEDDDTGDEERPGDGRQGDERPLILIADDNADMRRYIVSLLGDRCRTLAVQDGEAALAIARASRPDLVLADVMMPRLDGFGLLRGLRDDPRTRTVPVIMVSARAGEESRVDGMEAGADDYLVKPFSARELNARIAAHLAIASERRQVRVTLEEANRKKDVFMATLAHELRNPLAPIRNGLRILKLASDDPVAAEEAREMMERQVDQMVRLVDDLMDVSRINRGKIALRRARVPLSEPLAQALETSRPVIAERGHALVVETGQEALVIDADATRMAQVFANLLNNAAKYMEPKGTIEVTAGREDEMAVVRVRDTGVGIPPSMIPKVFELFTQVDEALERVQGGLGVGLSLVKILVEMHGGTVEAKSEGRGRGSEFVVRLPLAATVTELITVESAASPASAERRRVLIVDDNRDAAVSLAKLLELMGNDTRTAYDGLEALDAAEAFRPDLVMLDIGMPRLNGLDTARKIRGETWGREIALVALTGWGKNEDRRRSIEAGFDGHLVKPVEPDKLAKLLGGLRPGNRVRPFVEPRTIDSAGS